MQRGWLYVKYKLEGAFEYFTHNLTIKEVIHSLMDKNTVNVKLDGGKYLQLCLDIMAYLKRVNQV